METEDRQVTQLLMRWRNGDRAAMDSLMPLVYDELRRLAHRIMGRERRNHTLQTSALINEAYLRLVGREATTWQNRAHFFAVASQVMRHILIDYARRLQYEKHGAGAHRVPFDETAVFTEERASEFVALDDALNSLAEVDLRKSQIVELRFFGGLSEEETAEVMGISRTTVQREWRAARAWLHRIISGKNPQQNS